MSSAPKTSPLCIHCLRSTKCQFKNFGKCTVLIMLLPRVLFLIILYKIYFYNIFARLFFIFTILFSYFIIFLITMPPAVNKPNLFPAQKDSRCPGPPQGIPKPRLMSSSVILFSLLFYNSLAGNAFL